MFSPSQSLVTTEECPETDQSFACSQCLQMFPTAALCERHIRLHHPQPQDSPMCQQCGRSFPDQASLTRHVQSCQPSKSFPCTVCGKPFSERRYMITHLKRHAGVKNHVCSICGWRFFERTKLRWHMETHKAVSDRKLPYKCETCSKQFFNKATLVDHYNVHTGRKPFECPRCPATFSHRIGLKRHQLTHSGSAPLYLCSVCDRRFHTRSKLTAHMTRHTGVGKHQCPLCQKVFTVANSLKRHHYHCHQGEQYMCGVCGARFMDLSQAERHVCSSLQPSASSTDTTVLAQQVQTTEDLLAQATSSQEAQVASSVLASLRDDEAGGDAANVHLANLQAAAVEHPAIACSMPGVASMSLLEQPGLCNGISTSQLGLLSSTSTAGVELSTLSSGGGKLAGLLRHGEEMKMEGGTQRQASPSGMETSRSSQNHQSLLGSQAPRNGQAAAVGVSSSGATGVQSMTPNDCARLLPLLPEFAASQSVNLPQDVPNNAVVSTSVDVAAEAGSLTKSRDKGMLPGNQGGNSVCAGVSEEAVLSDPRLEGAVQLCLLQEGKDLAPLPSLPQS